MDLHKKSIPHKRDRLFDCRSSTKTAQEASDSEADWQQSTACFEVRSVLRQDFPRAKS